MSIVNLIHFDKKIETFTYADKIKNKKEYMFLFF